MFKNYLKIAFRNLLKKKLYSFINIIGLSVGITCCILIFLFVRSELTYDAFHEKKDNIFRIYTTREWQEQTRISPFVPMPFGPAILVDYPEIQSCVRFRTNIGVIRYKDNLLREQILFTDPSIFEVFSFPIIIGDSENVLKAPNSIVISETIAQKYFAGENPIAKQMSIRLGEEELDFLVTGVAQNAPTNSSIKFDFLVQFDRLADLSSGARVRAENWDSSNTNVFVRLNKQNNKADLESKLPAFAKKYFGDDPIEIYLQPLTDMHLNPEISGGWLEPVSDPMYSYILAGIALIVLLIACINFMTLSVGQSTSRAREVGMRKVMGAQRFQLLKQFWGEALLMSFFALILGIVFAEFFLPTFNNLTEKNLELDIISDGTTFLMLIGLVFLVGLISGSYPALFVSRFQPVEIFKNKFKIGGASIFGRVMVILQFSLSIFLIITTIILIQQKNYLMTKNLGFNQDQIIVIPTIRNTEGEGLLNTFRNKLSSQSSIVNMTGAAFSVDRGAHRVSASYQGQGFRTYELRVDYNYLAAMEMELVRGRNFSKEYATDPDQSVIVNETLVKEIGWDEPLGKSFVFRGKTVSVIGVAKDYHFLSLHDKIVPMVLNLDPETPIRYLLVKIRPDDIPGTLATIESKWKEIVPDLPFEYYFLDKDVTRQYRAEQRWGNIITYSSVFAIVIACLGLFGLSTLNVTQRVKEIGIRKVLGASVSSIALLLSKEFLHLVLFANVIAWPVAYYTTNKWLQSFAYRIDITWETFFFASLLAVIIALLTVSYQAVRSAAANPVNALRYE